MTFSENRKKNVFAKMQLYFKPGKKLKLGRIV